MSRPALIDKLMQAGKWLLKPELIPLSNLVKTGGGLAVDTETGKLYVDFSLVPDDQMQAIVLAMVQTGGGLAVDKTGKLYVDFASMPTDKFEAMLKSIRVPIWLTKNKNFYVNGASGSDTLDAGRGESTGKPFKTIQACVDYVCENYNIGPYNMVINVSAGTYIENIVIPEIARTTGGLYLWGHSETDTIIETVDNAPRQSSTITASRFSSVDIRRFTIRALDSKIAPDLSNVYVDAIAVEQYANVDIRECRLEGYQSIASDDIDLNRIRVASVSGALSLYAPMTIRGILDSTKSSLITGMVAYTGGTIYFLGDTNTYQFEISGDFIYTVNANGGTIARNVNTLPVITGEATGRRYYCAEGGHINTVGGGVEYFPGSIVGTVQDATYSWYR